MVRRKQHHQRRGLRIADSMLHIERKHRSHHMPRKGLPLRLVRSMLPIEHCSLHQRVQPVPDSSRVLVETVGRHMTAGCILRSGIRLHHSCRIVLVGQVGHGLLVLHRGDLHVLRRLHDCSLSHAI